MLRPFCFPPLSAFEALLTDFLHSLELTRMFKATAVLFSMVGVTEGFRMTSTRSTPAMKLSMQSGFEGEIGALPPVGYFDPLKLSEGIDKATFDQYRAAELKHGRVAQLAVVGYLVQENYRLPGAIDLDGTTFDSIPNGVEAIGAIPSLGWLQLVASIGYWELIGWEDKKGTEIGDYGFYLGKAPEGDKLTDLRTKEIQNGRLAMLAIGELITHNIVCFRPPDFLSYTAH